MRVNIRSVIIISIVYILVSFSLPNVSAAATIADLYSAPSEAARFSGATNSTCQNGETIKYCSDYQYSIEADVYTVLGDGSTSASSGASFQDKGNTQTSFLRLVYDVDGLYGGTYSLRYATASDTTFTYQICTYVDSGNFTPHSANFSSCKNYSHTAGDGQWVEADITELVWESVERFSYRVYLRLIATGDYSETATEVYLKRPLKPADFNIISEGVSETEINHRVINTWSIISIAEIPDITNASCVIYKLPFINESVSLLNLSLLDPQYGVCDDNKCFYISWNANESVDMMDEGYNYQVSCSGYLGDLWMDGFSQFVYINRERTFLDDIKDIIAYLLQIIGLGEDTQELVSAQADMVNAKAAYGQDVYITTFLTYADGTVDENATCYLDVWYPNSTQWLDSQQMNATGSDGRYIYYVAVPATTGLYQMRTYCNGTGLHNRTRYAYGNLEIYENDIMVMLS